MKTHPQSRSLYICFLVNIREADCMPLMQKRTKKPTRRLEGYWHEEKWESDCGRGASFNRAWGAGLSRFFPRKASATALDACCFIMMRLWAKCSQAYQISSKHVLNKSFFHSITGGCVRPVKHHGNEANKELWCFSWKTSMLRPDRDTNHNSFWCSVRLIITFK